MKFEDVHKYCLSRTDLRFEILEDGSIIIQDPIFDYGSDYFACNNGEMSFFPKISSVNGKVETVSEDLYNNGKIQGTDFDYSRTEIFYLEESDLKYFCDTLSLEIKKYKEQKRLEKLKDDFNDI